VSPTLDEGGTAPPSPLPRHVIPPDLLLSTTQPGSTYATDDRVLEVRKTRVDWLDDVQPIGGIRLTHEELAEREAASWTR
jgi:hypothetical protein